MKKCNTRKYRLKPKRLGIAVKLRDFFQKGMNKVIPHKPLAQSANSDVDWNVFLRMKLESHEAETGEIGAQSTSPKRSGKTE